MAEEITPWTIEQAKFQGFVKSELGNIKDGTTEIKLSIVAIDDRVRENEQAVSALKAKAAAYGTLGASIVMGLKWVWGTVA